MWGKKKEKEGTADRQISKREVREMQKKNVDEIEKVTFRVCGKRATYPRCYSVCIQFPFHYFYRFCVLCSDWLTDTELVVLCDGGNIHERQEHT